MVVDLDPILTLSSEEKLLRKSVTGFGEMVVGSDDGSDAEIDFFEAKPTSILIVPSIFKRAQLPTDDGNEFDLRDLGDIALLGGGIP
ncbi:hypothetical protein J1N35_006955 [Gossypium stocksii]|uniref:Uncharacterized protein n=1 Tax=Gossypium stocksii TaxID=47602 RepID=A0A9D4AD06_9ROSI|nr:hypothetical protein J1N35_006955 [Gossypium stocksii]